MSSRGFRVCAGFLTTAILLVVGCSTSTVRQTPTQSGITLVTPQSVSPGSIHPPPMVHTAILPASVMLAASVRAPKAAIAGLSYTQIPGAATAAAAAPDGSLWVLSTGPSGPDKYIWHYSGGSWTNISGLASAISVAPNGTLYAINSGGSAYAYSGGVWTGFGGGCRALTAAYDNSLYVISNGGGSDGPIWHYSGGNWTQQPGAGVSLVASWDPNSYSNPGGTITPYGLWVINSLGLIYYLGSSGYVQLAGSASAIAPITGGLFVLGYPTNPNGNALYYYDLANPGWSAEAGSGQSISSNGSTLYIVSTSGAIYSSAIAPKPTPTPTLTPTPTPTLAPTLPPISFGPRSIGWAPYAVAETFQFPVQSGYNGSGATIAIVGDYPPSLTDLNAYLAQFQIPFTGAYYVENVGAGSPMTDQDGLFESTLDVETVLGLAPGANVIYYSMPDVTGLSFLDAVNQILSDKYANVASASYGSCESSGDLTEIDPVLAQGANAGVAFVAAAGDFGDRCSPTSAPGVSFPASDPNVIGVGGTETSSTISSTTAWNDFFEINNGQGATGGGISALFALPQYQQGLPGEASASFRNVPDVAMPSVADEIYFQGQWQDILGTSWAAPQIAALVAEIYQYCNTAFQDPNLIFYYSFQTRGFADFVDVTSGNNDFGEDATFFAAGAGFDNVSGIGLPLGMPIAQTVCPNRVPVSLVRAERGALALTLPAPARPTLLRNVPNLEGLRDFGKRSDEASTRIALVLRATTTLDRDELSVVANLEAAGITVTRTFSNHLVIDARAPAAVLARYFGTEFRDFEQSGHGVRYANVLPVVLPPSIAPYVQGVVGDNLSSTAPAPRRMRSLNAALHRPSP